MIMPAYCFKVDYHVVMCISDTYSTLQLYVWLTFFLKVDVLFKKLKEMSGIEVKPSDSHKLIELSINLFHCLISYVICWK